MCRIICCESVQSDVKWLGLYLQFCIIQRGLQTWEMYTLVTVFEIIFHFLEIPFEERHSLRLGLA